MPVQFDSYFDGEPAYSVQQAAEFTGRTVGTLNTYRNRNTKPKFEKRSAKCVLYKEDALLDFLAAVQDVEKLVMRLHERIEDPDRPDSEGDRKWLARLCQTYRLKHPGEMGDG